MEEEPDAYLKLPIEERCVHKLWKARVSGYDDAVKKFRTLDGDDPNWKKFLGHVKKYITDTNAIAQEKGLEAALALVENCDSAGKVVGDCVEGIVLKCIGAPKTKTKEMAKQIILMFVEIEQQDKVVEELVKGLSQKNPKVVSGCVNSMTCCLRVFGAKVLKVSPLLKAVVPLLDHRDKTVRDEGKLLIIEAHRWVGDVMKVQLTGLKPVQLTELEAEFGSVEDVKPKPERLLRSQQGVVDDATAVAGGVDADGRQDDECEVGNDELGNDPYDMIDPVNILVKLPSDFYSLAEEKKWQLRQEALNALFSLSQNPKIESGDFGDIVRVLKKFIGKDTNVMLVSKAAQCVAGLAKGLRANFKFGAGQILPLVLEKFKEKKPTVVAALREAADAMYPCLGVEAIQEDCLVALKHKTPSVVMETSKFLARSFSFCPGALVSNKKMMKGYVSALHEKLNHSDPTVREGATEALGVLVKVLGELAVLKFMPELEAIKVSRIKEFAEKAELKGKLPKVAAGVAAESGSKTKVVKPKTSEKEKPQPPPAKKTSTAAAPSQPQRKTTVKAKAPVAVKKDDVDLSPPYRTNDLKKVRFKDESRLKLLKWNFVTPRPEFVDQLQEQVEASEFNSTLQSQMFHKDFKQHLKAIETLTKVVESDVQGLISNLDMILKWTTLRFSETNPSVLLKSLEYLGAVFSVLGGASYVMHDLEASSFVPYLVQKVGDPKDQVRSSIRAIFKSMCQVYPASKFSPYLMEGLRHKNAKLRTECLDEIGLMVKHHGINVLTTPAACFKEVAKSISDRDNSVRSAALNAITEAHFQVGEKMYKMVGNLPEKDMAMLEERIKRVNRTRPVHPLAIDQTAATSSETTPMPPSVIPQPSTFKSSLPTTATSRIKNFRQFPVPGGGPLPNFPPPVGNETRKSSVSAARPVSGAFTLDLDKIEDSAGEQASGRSISLQLVNHDLDEILNGDPVKLPSTFLKRPTSSPPPAVNLADSEEAKEALDVVLAQVFSTDPKVCLSALAQLQELLKDEDKALLMGTRMDQLLQACYMQYRNVLNSIDSSDQLDTMSLFQSLTMVLMSTYHNERITQRSTSGPLHDLLQVIITVLLDPRVHQLPPPDGDPLLKALNLLTVKILDRSDPTSVTSAIVKVLHDCLSNGNAPSKFVELVMKCLWKLLRHIPKWLDSGSLNLDVVMLDVHNFMKKYPTAYWKKQELDTPMRTIKTLLHSLVKGKGDVVLDHLTRVNDPQASEMVPYLRKLLSSGVGGKENVSNAADSATSKVPPSRFSKSDHETLAEIFKKIGHKEQTKQGLQELKNFKQQNPQADIEPFLAKSSQYFRNYIERGLASIEAEPSTSGSRVLSEARDANPQDVGGMGGTTSSSVFLDKLKMLRERGGLDKGSAFPDDGGVSSIPNSTSDMYRISAHSTTTTRSNASESQETSKKSEQPSQSDMEAIRRRLEKVKHSGF